MSKREEQTPEGPALVFDMWPCSGCGTSNIWMRGQCRSCGKDQTGQEEKTEAMTAPLRSNP